MNYNFIFFEDELNDSLNSSFLYDLDIITAPKVKGKHTFPDEFSINLNKFNRNLSCTFVKLPFSDQPDVYVIDSLTGDPVKYIDSDFDRLSEVNHKKRVLNHNK